MQIPVDNHLNLMEGEHRGWRLEAACSRSTDNLVINKMLIEDCHRGKRNISMACFDVKKAYDCVNRTFGACAGRLFNTKYLKRLNAALKVLFLEMLRQLKLGDTVLSWSIRADSKPLYESHEAKVYWDVPVFADHTFVNVFSPSRRAVWWP